MRHYQKLGLLSLCSLFAACDVEMDDPDLDDEEVAEATDAFSSLSSLTTVANGAFASSSTAVSSGTSAFLSSVGGTLASPGSDPYPYVNAFIFSGNFYLTARPGSAFTTLGGQGWAVYTGTTPQTAKSCSNSGSGTDSEELTVPNSPNYACFLTSVRNVQGNAFNSWDDSAIISYPNGVPTLTCTNDAEASAACIPVTTTVSTWAVGSPSIADGAYMGPVDWVNGKVCMLHGISGSFRTNNAGVGVASYVSGNAWWLSTAVGTGAHVTCVR